MNDSDRVVFDCNVYFQAFIAPNGPAGEAFNAVKEQRLVLYASATVLAELFDVCSRPHFQRFTRDWFEFGTAVLLAGWVVSEFVSFN